MPIAPQPPLAEAAKPADALADALAEIAALRAELDDLQLLYEATIAHGEAVEDQLAENNLLLQKTEARLRGELDDAARYVASILPEERQAHPQTRWVLAPSTELGGDSFGYRDIDGDRIAFYLIDVCGHGVGAALLSVAAINVLRAGALADTDFSQPDRVLAALNDAFPMERQNNMFFTVWYGVWQRSTGLLRYATGGHPPALLIRAGDGGTAPRAVEELIVRGNMAIGALGGMDYDCASVQVAPGDRLLVLSDGSFEIPLADGGELDLADLAAHVATPGNDEPAHLLDWARAQCADPAGLPDDLSLLSVRF